MSSLAKNATVHSAKGFPPHRQLTTNDTPSASSRPPGTSTLLPAPASCHTKAVSRSKRTHPRRLQKRFVEVKRRVPGCPEPALLIILSSTSGSISTEPGRRKPANPRTCWYSCSRSAYLMWPRSLRHYAMLFSLVPRPLPSTAQPVLSKQPLGNHLLLKQPPLCTHTLPLNIPPTRGFFSSLANAFRMQTPRAWWFCPFDDGRVGFAL